MFDAIAFMKAVAAQDADALRDYFAKDAAINWHDSNECFTVEEYIRANCEYPGDWQANVIRAHKANDVTVFAAKVYNSEGFAVHVVSFVTLDESGKIVRLDEYFSDCSEPPQWRKDMKIGRPINN
ncbi:MAG: nuclear transport factor 2 family protein [Defluviitaleaceae bacterium]|nr:nuclear transport factor 2 family protein [Defluviitaleaceae bacterium]